MLGNFAFVNRRALGVCVVGLLLVVAGCSGDEGDDVYDEVIAGPGEMVVEIGGDEPDGAGGNVTGVSDPDLTGLEPKEFTVWSAGGLLFHVFLGASHPLNECLLHLGGDPSQMRLRAVSSEAAELELAEIGLNCLGNPHLISDMADPGAVAVSCFNPGTDRTQDCALIGIGTPEPRPVPSTTAARARAPVTTAAPATPITRPPTRAPTTTRTPSITAARSGPFRIAVVAPSASNDLAFTQSIVEGVKALGNRVAEWVITDGTFIVEEAALAIRGYAEEGYDLVIAHGSQYGGSLQEIAPDFPDVTFAWGTAADTFGLDNVYAYTAASDEGGCVLGAVAAHLTPSGNIGVVGPVEVGDAKLYVDGFKHCAENEPEQPGINVNVVYIDSFSDVAKAAETAESHIANGADILTGVAQMVVGAVGVAQENDVWWFGTQADQRSLAPSLVVASQVYNWEVVLEEILDDIARGTPRGRAFTIDLANGGLEIAFNYAVAVPPNVLQRADEVIAGIIGGSINTDGPTLPSLSFIIPPPPPLPTL